MRCGAVRCVCGMCWWIARAWCHEVSVRGSSTVPARRPGTDSPCLVRLGIAPRCQRLFARPTTTTNRNLLNQLAPSSTAAAPVAAPRPTHRSFQNDRTKTKEKDSPGNVKYRTLFPLIANVSRETVGLFLTVILTVFKCVFICGSTAAQGRKEEGEQGRSG